MPQRIPNTEALKAFAVKPQDFYYPTQNMPTKRFVSIYDTYAQQLGADNSTKFIGLERYLKGEALAFYDRWKALNREHDYDYFSADFCREFSVLGGEEAQKGPSYRYQGKNESVESYSREMLVLLAQGDFPPKSAIELYVSNMLPHISNTVAKDHPTTLQKARKLAVRAQSYFQNTPPREVVYVNAIQQDDKIEKARQLLADGGLDPSDLYIAPKRSSRGRSTERQPAGAPRRQQSHSRDRGSSKTQSSSQQRSNSKQRSNSRPRNGSQTRSSSGSSGQKYSNEGAQKSSSSKSRSRSPETHKEYTGRTGGRSATPYRQSKN